MAILTHLNRYRGAVGCALFMTLAACTEDFDPKIETEPVAVINLMLTADSTVSASVTRSWPFGQDRPSDVSLADSHVSMRVNDAGPTELAYDTAAQAFVSGYRVHPGDRVRVEAITRRYGRVSGYTEVPHELMIDSIEMKCSIAPDPYSIVYMPDGTMKFQDAITARYRLTFTDPGDEENYYLLAGRRVATDGDGIFGETNSIIDAVLDYSDSYLLMFSDRSINGRTFTLDFYSRYGLLGNWEWPQDPATGRPVYEDSFRFYSISREYYSYIMSISRKYNGLNGDLEDIGFAEPTAIYTNVEGGAGIVCSQTGRSFVFDLSDEVRKYHEQQTDD